MSVGADEGTLEMVPCSCLEGTASYALVGCLVVVVDHMIRGDTA